MCSNPKGKWKSQGLRSGVRGRRRLEKAVAVAGKARVGGKGSGDNKIECHKRIFHARGKLNENIIYLIYMRLVKIETGKKKSSILIRTARSGKDGGQRGDFVRI